MVEQWTHKPLDVGSNPTLATIYLSIHPTYNINSLSGIKGMALKKSFQRHSHSYFFTILHPSKTVSPFLILKASR